MERTDERTTGPEPADPGDGAPATERTSASPLRIASVLIGAVVAVALFLVAFDYLRDPNANRATVVGLAIVVGVGGVFLLFWMMNRVVDLLSERLRERVRPYVFVGPALGPPGRVPGVPRVQHDLHQLRERQLDGVRGTGQLQVRLHRRQHAAVDPQHGGVADPRAVGRGEHRARVRDHGRQAPARRGGGEVVDLPSDGDLVRGRLDHVAADLQLPFTGLREQHRAAQRDHARAGSGPRQMAGAPAVEQPAS